VTVRMSILDELSLFIFRRDLRLHDNTALIEALKNSRRVVACFILDPRQLKRNPFFSRSAAQFMVECLQDLDQELKSRGGKLYFFNGIAERVISQLISSETIGSVYINRDYTPFSRKRDGEIVKPCLRRKIACHILNDALLTEPEEITSGSGKPYTVFTPFFTKANSMPVRRCISNPYRNYYTQPIKLESRIGYHQLLHEKNEQGAVHGGRSNGLRLVNRLGSRKNYEVEKDLPARNGTTGLSAHIKFGTVSIREVYHAIVRKLGREHPLLRQLYWRDFYTHIAFHFPHVFGHAFRREYDRIRWVRNDEGFKAWCQGRTGFPIVDAGMRQLNTTGFMHNRVRMIVASFLTKDLHVDWRRGEWYFAKNLVDYDPSVNNGNWQWSASTGCDAQPWFRIFNPWRQQRRFDPDCEYVKRWVQEIEHLTPSAIHDLELSRQVKGYTPILDHRKESLAAKNLYRQQNK